jgi:hypothetical protein
LGQKEAGKRCKLKVEGCKLLNTGSLRIFWQRVQNITCLSSRGLGALYAKLGNLQLSTFNLQPPPGLTDSLGSLFALFEELFAGYRV